MVSRSRTRSLPKDYGLPLQRVASKQGGEKMEYEQALIIGKRRRADAAMALAGYVRERVTEVCAVKPAKGAGLDAKDWEPVGEENFKEICIHRGPTGDEEVYLVLVDGDGTPKALTQRTYPLPLALQMAQAIPLPTYAGPGAVLWELLQAQAERRAKEIVQTPEV